MADDGWITIEYDGDGHDLTELVFFSVILFNEMFVTLSPFDAKIQPESAKKSELEEIRPSSKTEIERRSPNVGSEFHSNESETHLTFL